MAHPLPLSALLSQTLVAFTIECDNEFEHQIPHRTTNFGSTFNAPHAPWLVSMVIWSKFLQHVPETGITVREFQRLSRSSDKAWLVRLAKWWRYLTITPDVSRTAPKRLDPDAIVRPAPGASKAFSVWPTVAPAIEHRWRKRFGHDEIDRLRQSLWAIVAQFPVDLPGYMPIIAHGLFTKRREPKPPPAPAEPVPLTEYTLLALLSKTLVGFALHFERESPVSLAISANVLRLAEPHGIALRHLPTRAGISKEAVAMSAKFLGARGYADIKPESPNSRNKLLFLTPEGDLARTAYRDRTGAIEVAWETRFGKKLVRTLRDALEQLVLDGTPENSPLFSCLTPYPDNWRAAVPPREALPHFPVVTHRGGYPDGS